MAALLGLSLAAPAPAAAERISGRDLDEFFSAWLYRAGKPQAW